MTPPSLEVAVLCALLVNISGASDCLRGFFTKSTLLIQLSSNVLLHEVEAADQVTSTKVGSLL